MEDGCQIFVDSEDEAHSLVRVVRLRVDRQRRYRELEVFGVFEGFGYRGAVGRAGLVYRVAEPVHRVVGERDVAELLRLVLIGVSVELEYRLERWLREVAGAEDEVAAFDGGASYLSHELAVAVAAEDCDVAHAELAGLLDDERHVLTHAGHEEDIGVSRFDFRELGSEVDVVGTVGFVGYHHPAVLFEVVDEILAQPVGVVGADVIDDGGRFCPEVLEREVRAEESLVRVVEGEAEGVRADVALRVDRHERVGGRRAYLRHLRLVDERRRRYVDAARVRADYRDDVVALYHAPHGVDRVFGTRLRVVDDELYRTPEDAAFVVALRNVHLSGLDLRDSVGCVVAGERGEITDLNRLSREGRSR